MKLPARVIEVVRGVGGVALLAAAGCGASQPTPVRVQPEEIVLVQHHELPRPKPPQPAEVEPWPEDEPWTYPDVHPACGRG